VRDLRNLRDAAFTLWSYGRPDDCERLLGNIRELLAGPPIGDLGDNDEEAAADRQIAASEPKVLHRGLAGRLIAEDGTFAIFLTANDHIHGTPADQPGPRNPPDDLSVPSRLLISDIIKNARATGGAMARGGSCHHQVSY
jgi:hypothetical protein